MKQREQTTVEAFRELQAAGMDFIETTGILKLLKLCCNLLARILEGKKAV